VTEEDMAEQAAPTPANEYKQRHADNRAQQDRQYQTAYATNGKEAND